jgi:hypothetical protein
MLGASRQGVVIWVLSNREEGLGLDVDQYMSYWVEAHELPETEPEDISRWQSNRRYFTALTDYSLTTLDYSALYFYGPSFSFSLGYPIYYGYHGIGVIAGTTELMRP